MDHSQIQPMIYFTRRERQVLEELLKAASTKRTAADLNISTTAVYALMRQIRTKLGLEDDRAVVRWVALHEEDVRRGCTRAYESSKAA